jgi:hypothetical protein
LAHDYQRSESGMEIGRRAPGWRRQKGWTRLLLWLLTPPAIIAGAFQLQPTYVVLDIPVAPNPVGYFWWEEQRSQLEYADSGGVLYLHRQVGTAYTHMHGWRTADEAFAHFDRWLSANGWSYLELGSHDRNSTFPESEFLKPEQSRRNRRTSDRSILAVVAVWPIGSSVEGFHVVLVTERPSWARRLECVA